MNYAGYENIQKIEGELTSYALDKLLKNPNVNILGPKNMKARGAVISFTYKDVHPHDLASIVDSYGIALRSGHHCAQPLMKYLKVNSSARISFSFYNTKEEIDEFLEALMEVRKVLHLGA
jgi:cysteine desulfurase/selenocysteine lyase